MPAIRYVNAENKRIPSFSTIDRMLGGDKAERLKYWANNLGLEGISLRDYDAKKAAEIGSCAHEMMDCYFKDKKFDESSWPMETLTKAKKAYENMLSWVKQTDVYVIASELSLVSEEHQFGGTIDLVAVVNQKMSLLDLKTGADIYESAYVQLEAYKLLWNENFPDSPIECFHVIRTGKELAMFVHSQFNEGFPQALEMFLLCRRQYDLAKEIKKLK